MKKFEEMRCCVCGSKKVDSLIFGMPYCKSCASKLIKMHLVKFLTNLRKEGLIPSTIKIPEI